MYISVATEFSVKIYWYPSFTHGYFEHSNLTFLQALHLPQGLQSLDLTSYLPFAELYVHMYLCVATKFSKKNTGITQLPRDCTLRPNFLTGFTSASRSSIFRFNFLFAIRRTIRTYVFMCSY